MLMHDPKCTLHFLATHAVHFYENDLCFESDDGFIALMPNMYVHGLVIPRLDHHSETGYTQHRRHILYLPKPLRFVKSFLSSPAIRTQTSSG